MITKLIWGFIFINLVSCHISQNDHQRSEPEIVTGLGNQELPIYERNLNEGEHESLKLFCEVLERKAEYMFSQLDDTLFYERNQEYHYCGQSNILNKSQAIRFFVRSYNKILPEYYFQKSKFYFNDPLFANDIRFANYCEKAHDTNSIGINNVQNYIDDKKIIMAISRLRNGNFLVNWRIFKIEDGIQKTYESSSAEISGDSDDLSSIGIEKTRTRRRLCDNDQFDYLKETSINL